MLSQRARISPSAATTAVSPQLTVSGNGNIFSNFSLFEGNTTAADSTCVSVTGNRNVFHNVAMMNMGGNTGGDAVTRAGSDVLSLNGAEENIFTHCHIGLDTATRTAANANVRFAGSAARNLFEDCIFPMHSTGNSALFIDAATANDLDRWTIFRRCLFVNAVSSASDSLTEVASISSIVAGMIVMDNSFFVGADDWEGTASGNLYMGMPVADVAGADAGGALTAHT